MRTIFFILLLVCSNAYAQQGFPVSGASIVVDEHDITLVKKVAGLFQNDIELLTGKKPALTHKLTPGNIILIGSIDSSSFIKKLKLDLSKIKGKWEAYQMQVVKNPFPGVKQALVIIGSDRRGTAYGVLELSKKLGVSPWYWWADVPVEKKTSLYVPDTIVTDAPAVKYRGIFINDEAPALSGWSKEKFGGFNHL
ncbi:MAG TPA: glycosyl hydrolase 115 family protein, partial [Chitinophagaceae bacterium]|nr:glycosyl hydrolase 115 family protein [Chitinophagaceae bacterium]